MGRRSSSGAAATSSTIYNNGVSTQVVFGLPTATCEVGSLAAHECLTSRAALDQIGMFVNDTWAVGRMTLNAGVRYDRYNGWLPEQQQLGATVGRAVVAGEDLPEDRPLHLERSSRRASAWSST